MNAARTAKGVQVYKPSSRELDRFWSKVRKSETGCWEWLAAKSSKGYGSFMNDSGSRMAHRYSYLIHNGDLPDGLFVCHSCDNPGCVRPDHLELGDQFKNMGDASSRRRIAMGERQGLSKLTERDVEIIARLRQEGMSCYKLARVFGVAANTISRIFTGDHWNHVTGLPRPRPTVNRRRKNIS